MKKKRRTVVIMRIAAQTGSASALGVGGCWFESDLSDCRAA